LAQAQPAIITTFSVGTTYSYDQTSAGQPILDTNTPFLFSASTVLASNRTANAITLIFPNSTVSNLTQDITSQGDYYLFGSSSDSNRFVTAFPAGQYSFTVSATSSNQTVSLLLPAATTQPNAPHLTNFIAAQAVEVSQPFKFIWEPFLGGTTNDFIAVSVGNNIWKTPTPGSAGALNGTIIAAVIPAGTLQPNSNYACTISFYHATIASNATYVTEANRAAATQFPLSTVGATIAAPVITNVVWNGSGMSFDIDTTPGQVVTILYSTNCTQPLNQWPVLLTTNSPATRVHVTDSASAGRPVVFYRARIGP